jgi:PilZ domain
MQGGYGRRKEAILARSRVVPAEPAKASGAPNRRFAPRRKSQTPGFIFAEGSTSSIPCQIADMSTTGARLLLQEGWSNPFLANEADTLTLVVRLDKVMYDCKIARREERELGIAFLTAPRPYAPRKGK